MDNITVTIDENGYVDNFVRVGELSDGIIVPSGDFNAEYFYCYKLVDGRLVFDDTKYQKTINPTLAAPVSELDILRDYVLDMELRIIIKELGV